MIHARSSRSNDSSNLQGLSQAPNTLHTPPPLSDFAHHSSSSSMNLWRFLSGALREVKVEANSLSLDRIFAQTSFHRLPVFFVVTVRWILLDP